MSDLPRSTNPLGSARPDRRTFLKTGGRLAAALLAGSMLPGAIHAANRSTRTHPRYAGPIIDIHQHTRYHDRNDLQMVRHQREMGMSHTILLPAGEYVNTPATHDGESNGLGGVNAGGNASCRALANRYPGEFLFGANAVPDMPDATRRIETALEQGACVIGEMKYGLACDSPQMKRIYEVARAWDVPVLLHWQHDRYNLGFDRFHKVLEEFPDVNFIGHAQTWWVNIDKAHEDQSVLYPDGSVTAGGWTDTLLSDYGNCYGDLSAGSGLNALRRDPEHAAWFLEKHQEKLLYGSDCADAVGTGPDCQGYGTLETVRSLCTSRQMEEKLLHGNARTLFHLEGKI
ncbi:MAG: amidohydrolase family protein [Balneolaceae bacterium]